jgi:hypothetical protein
MRRLEKKMKILDIGTVKNMESKWEEILRCNTGSLICPYTIGNSGSLDINLEEGLFITDSGVKIRFSDLIKKSKKVLVVSRLIISENPGCVVNHSDQIGFKEIR